MNFQDIQQIVNHIRETCECLTCKKKFDTDDIHVFVATKNTGMFEMVCKKCDSISIATAVVSKRTHRSISKDEVLDMKNFMGKFDGDFKKIFTNQE
ncbi:hypothetical protein HZC20_02240 [Candidatus Peregrinibacteria bacterium]|nr:hypothetical protein [Candidatus Peregrinibacteria bacterium]